MKLRQLLTALAMAGALAACGSTTTSTAATSSEANAASTTSKSAATTATTTSATKSATSTSTSKVNPLTALCADHCDALETIGGLPPCGDDTKCSIQIIAADDAVTAFMLDLTTAGLDITLLPSLESAYNDYREARQDFDDTRYCHPMRFDGSDEALTCGITVLLIKTDAQLLGVTLKGLAA